MATFKDLEDSLKSFITEEQSDAHNIRNTTFTKYNNIKIWMDRGRFQEPHFIVRISISEGVYSLSGCTKLSGGLGYEERLVIKWCSRIGVKDKLRELWGSDDNNKDKKK